MIPNSRLKYRYRLQQSFLIFHKYFTFYGALVNKSEVGSRKSEVTGSYFSFNFLVDATRIATISPASINKGLNLAGSTVLDSINISNQYENKSEVESRKSEVKNQYLLPTSDFKLPTWSEAL